MVCSKCGKCDNTVHIHLDMKLGEWVCSECCMYCNPSLTACGRTEMCSDCKAAGGCDKPGGCQDHLVDEGAWRGELDGEYK